MSEFVRLAVPLPIFRTFTYRVPSSLRARLHLGTRVLAPFRNSELTGLVVGFDEAAGEGELKDIYEVLDDEPLLSPALIRLAQWISERYLAPMGESCRVMLPPGLMLRSTKKSQAPNFWPVRKQKAVTAISRKVPELTEKQARAWARIKDCRLPLACSALSRETDVTESILATLASKGAIRIEKIEIQRSPWDDYFRMNANRPVVRHDLTEEQGSVFGELAGLLDSRRYSSALIHGITGSGKTEVYLSCIERALGQGRSAIMLVPEIGLTPQVSHAFRGWFGDRVAILHSALSEGERFDQWRRIRLGRAPVVLGTRSAVFAPAKDLGLLIVDEEHDTSYKQDELPRYHARETALKRAEIEGALAVLGSATPQLETYHAATEGRKHQLLQLTKRVRERPLPAVHLVDMREEFAKHGSERSVISQSLEEAVRERLRKGEQVLVFLNRRGYTPVLLCRSCGESEVCENCSISLTYHRGFRRLLCHYCGYDRSLPKNCRACGKPYIFYLGEGTEKIEEMFSGLFPEARIDRLDRDTARRKGAYDRILGRFSSQETDILIGTQMIAKGHDFPNVTLVGVLAADQSLKLADFRSAERTFQLLTQVSGRSGRGEAPGDVIIQTHYPNHYSLRYACTQEYGPFYRHESGFRRRFRYPPYSLLANLILKDPDRGQGEKQSKKVADLLFDARDRLSSRTKMRILGPAPAAIERLRGEYRFQVLIKAVSRLQLNSVLKDAVDGLGREKFNLRKIAIDIDPSSLL